MYTLLHFSYFERLVHNTKGVVYLNIQFSCLSTDIIPFQTPQGSKSKNLTHTVSDGVLTTAQTTLHGKNGRHRGDGF